MAQFPGADQLFAEFQNSRQQITVEQPQGKRWFIVPLDAMMPWMESLENAEKELFDYIHAGDF